MGINKPYPLGDPIIHLKNSPDAMVLPIFTRIKESNVDVEKFWKLKKQIIKNMVNEYPIIKKISLGNNELVFFLIPKRTEKVINSKTSKIMVLIMLYGMSWVASKTITKTTKNSVPQRKPVRHAKIADIFGINKRANNRPSKYSDVTKTICSNIIN
jgi:hypothetical protein